MPMYNCIFYMENGTERFLWDSQFEFLVTDDIAEAAARLAHFHHHNETVEGQENIGDFEIYLTINGMDKEKCLEDDSLFLEIETMVDQNMVQLRAQAEAKREAKRLEEARRAEELALQKAIEVERKERELLERLRKKYT